MSPKCTYCLSVYDPMRRKPSYTFCSYECKRMFEQTRKPLAETLGEDKTAWRAVPHDRQHETLGLREFQQAYPFADFGTLLLWGMQSSMHCQICGISSYEACKSEVANKFVGMREGGLVPDFIVPLAFGGVGTLKNLRMVCVLCSHLRLGFLGIDTVRKASRSIYTKEKAYEFNKL